MWRAIRISLLLLILLTVGASAVIDRWSTATWDDTLSVGVYPILADNSAATATYLGHLSTSQLAPIEEFFATEAQHYRLSQTRPVKLWLYPALQEPPPRLDPNSGALSTILWSLRLRWYTWQKASDHVGKIRVFVLYHDPSRTPVVPHSLGMRKGLIGVVYAFAAAEMIGTNNMVIAHEVLHALGATDKYDMQSLQPIYPQGYGDRNAQPRHPQEQTEIMAGRRAISEHAAEQPTDLSSVVIGPETAAEISWTK